MFVINSSALEKHIKPSQFIHVYYDEDTGKVGLKPLPKKADKAYRLNVSPKGNVGTVSATAFLSFIGYKYKDTINFPATWNEEEGLLEFAIKSNEGRHAKRLPR
jgi:hypothetical protein